jgi:hypothetical protein
MSFNKLIRLYAGNATEIEDGKYTTSLDVGVLTNVVAVALKTITFRNNVYNVNEYNNIITFEAAVGPTIINASVEIPVGQYSISQLLPILVPLIDAELITFPATVTLVLNPITLKIEYTITGADYIIFEPSSILGIPTITSPSTSGTFDNLPGLGGLSSVTCNIRSKEPFSILNLTPTKNLYTSSLGVIPVNVPFGVLQTYSQNDLNDTMLTFSSSNDMKQLQFVLRDVNGKIITQQKNDLVVELMVYYDQN